MYNLLDLKEKIINSRLTKKESDIAEYILHNFNIVCFMSASDLAKKLNTSNTSVNRTAKALGYNSYNDLRKGIQEYISMKTDACDKFKLPPNQRIVKINNGSSKEDFLTRYLELASNNISSVLSKNSISKIDRIVDIIAKSNHKYISGLGSTGNLANKFGFLLSLIVDNVVQATGEDFDIVQKVISIGKDDCIIVISFNRYSRNTLDIIKISKERAAKLILITDRATAPFSQYADELLIVDVASLSYFNSNIAPMFLIELICTKLAFRLDEVAKKRLDALEPYMNKNQVL